MLILRSLISSSLLIVACQSFVLFFPQQLRPEMEEELGLMEIPTVKKSDSISLGELSQIINSVRPVTRRGPMARRSVGSSATYLCPCRHKVCATGNECVY